jgi:mono/diheme cytochrome c family protein
MKQHLLILALASLPFWWACGEIPAEGRGSSPEFAALADTISNPDREAGLALLRQNCYACHNPAAPSHDEILAPPLAAAKWRYRQSYPERNEFITHMTAYVHQPSADKALMRGPVRRFGVMPPTTLTEETIRTIVTFIYDHELEAPVWFSDHFEAQHGTSRKQ